VPSVVSVTYCFGVLSSKRAAQHAARRSSVESGALKWAHSGVGGSCSSARLWLRLPQHRAWRLAETEAHPGVAVADPSRGAEDPPTLRRGSLEEDRAGVAPGPTAATTHGIMPLLLAEALRQAIGPAAARSDRARMCPGSPRSLGTSLSLRVDSGARRHLIGPRIQAMSHGVALPIRVASRLLDPPAVVVRGALGPSTLRPGAWGMAWAPQAWATARIDCIARNTPVRAPGALPAPRCQESACRHPRPGTGTTPIACMVAAGPCSVGIRFTLLCGLILR
jgi:hypothetical protein